MALVIRMRQQGRKNRQTYRLVVTDSRNPRDGKYLESLGSYNPSLSTNNLTVNEERLGYWMDQGAQLSDRAKRLVKKTIPTVVKNYETKKEEIKQKYRLKRRKRTKTAAQSVKLEASPKVEGKVTTSTNRQTSSSKKKIQKDEN